LLVGREDLEDGEIKDNEIGNDEKNIEIADCEKKILNYADRCAISLYFANLIVDKAAIEIVNTY
jgi:hypothetical protein